MLNFGIRTGALFSMFENVIWGFIKSLSKKNSSEDCDKKDKNDRF